MATHLAKPQKRLGEFLNEKQEPFMLELYLLERGYTKSLSLNKKRKRKVLLPFSKALISIVNKLAFQSQSNTLPTTRDYEQRKKHAICMEVRPQSLAKIPLSRAPNGKLFIFKLCCTIYMKF